MSDHTCIWINNEQQCRTCGAARPMPEAIKNDLYVEFRNRLIDEMTKQFDPYSYTVPISSMLRIWRNELKLASVKREPSAMYRTCGLCGEQNIPYGVDWVYWHDGKPVHSSCLMMERQPR